MTTIEQIIANFKGTTFSSPEDVEKWLRQALEQIRKETIEECIELSDKIELLEPDGGTEQWRAFKAFRNTMRDRLANLNNLK